MHSYFMVLLISSIFLSFQNSTASLPILKFKSPIETSIFSKWMDRNILITDTITAWLVADDEDDETVIDQFKQDFNKLTFKLNAKIDRDDDVYDIAEEIFEYLHDHILRHYRESGRLIKIIENGEYTAISASILYYLSCLEFDIPIHIMMGKSHIITTIHDREEIININIVDADNGFNLNISNEDIINSLLNLGIVTKNELDLYGRSEIFNKYIGIPVKLNEKELMAILYNNRAVQFLSYGNFEEALIRLEKALVLYPEEIMIINNYKTALYNLNDITTDYSDFIPYYKNALYFLRDDISFIDIAIGMAKHALYELADEQREYKTALELALDLKTSFIHEKYLIAIADMERDIEFTWAENLYTRGEYKLAYQKFRDFYYNNKSNPKYKDVYVQISLEYIKYLWQSKREIKRANNIIDSLLIEASDYAVVKEFYFYSLIDAFNNCITNNILEAKRIAIKAFSLNSQHQFSRMAISRVYHEMAMTAIRKNELRNAYKILLEGLKYLPNDRLLNEDIDQLDAAL